MIHTARIDLPDGRQIDYEIRPSAKGRSLRLKMTARDGLTVIAPRGLSKRQIVKLVAGKRDWIAARLDQFKEVRHLLGETSTACPQAFDLPALAESWRIEYRETKSQIIGAKTDRPGRLLVYGAVGDSERSKTALRRWLARHAKETLGYWLESLAAETGLRFSRLTIKSQRTRWGSCSVNGVISLNCKLLFLSVDLVRYVLIHELCHTLEHNHSSRFWAHLRQFEPKTDALQGEMRESWKRIPVWAHSVQAIRGLF